jgi:hypothetical protein
MAAFMSFLLAVLLLPALAAVASEATIHQEFRYQLPKAKATWAAVDGLPSGLRILPESGEIWGAPNESGRYSLAFQAGDGSRFTLDLKVNALWNVSLTPPHSGVGAPFSHRQVVAGGTPPYAFSADGLVPGLSISPAGVISGTPAKAGKYPATITAADHAGNSLTFPYSLTVNAVGIVTQELQFAEIDKPYSQQLVAAGGKPPYVWKLDYRGCMDLPQRPAVEQSIIATGPPVFNLIPTSAIRSPVPAPPQPVLSADGWLTIQTPLPYDITVCAEVTDAAGNQAASLLTIVSLVPGDSPIDASIGLRDLISVGDPVIATVIPSAGTSPYEITAPALPPGFAFFLINPDEGLIFGYPQQAGNQIIRIQVKDGTGAIVQREATLHVSPIRVGAASGDDPTYGKAFSRQFYAVNAAPPYSWSLAPDARFAVNDLPTGLEFSASGLLSGTPLEAGYFSLPTGRVTDTLGNTAEFALLSKVSAATPGTLDLYSSERPFFTLGRETTYSINVGSGKAPYTWKITGVLPPGMIELDNPASVTFWGVPNSGGRYLVTVQVTDANGNVGIRVIPMRVTSIHNDNSSLDFGIVGEYSRIQLTADGGSPPYRWSAIAFSLPPGMGLSSDGVLSGIPAQSRNFNFKVSVTDAASESADLRFDWAVYDGPTIIPPAPRPAIKGVPFSQQFEARGGSPGYTWRMADPTCLLDGLVFTSGGLLNGTLTRSGYMYCDIVVRDSQGRKADMTYGGYAQDSQPAHPSISGPLFGSGSAGQQISVPVSISAAEPYSVEPGAGSEFPPGLVFDARAGAFTGYPAKAGAYAFGIQVTDAFGQQATARGYIYVSPLHIIPGVPDGTYKRSYSYQFRIVEHVQPLLWTLAPRSRVPAGLTLTPEGLLAGTPVETGNFRFVVRANDASVTVYVSIGSGSPHTYSGGPWGPFDLDLGRTTGGISLAIPAHTVASIESGSLPPGLTLSSDGRITGTPSVAGVFTFSMRLDGDGGFGIAVIVIRVGLPRSERKTLNAAVTGKPYSAQLQGGSLAPGESLPPGMSLSPDGKLSGTPTTPWLYQFSTLLNDAPGDAVVSSYTLEVINP